MSLERIIRPFQTGDAFTARRLPPTEQPGEPQEDVVVDWGTTISSNYNVWEIQNGLIGGNVQLTEQSRVTSTQRIENPDDPDQFVEVERIEKLVLASDQGHQLNFTLNN